MRTVYKIFLLVTLVSVGCAPAPEKTAETNLLSSSAPLKFHVLSNCPSAATEITISVDTNTIVAPNAISFRDFGFPSRTVILGTHEPVAGDYSGVQRTCTYPRSTEGVHTHHAGSSMTYICTEYGFEICQIQFALVVDGEHEH